MKNNILILGGTGFIGRNLSEALEASDNARTVILLSRKKIDMQPGKGKNSQIHIQGEIHNLPLIIKILNKYNIDTVIHLASSLIPSSNRNDFQNEVRKIISPTFNVLDYLSEKNIKIVYFSSGGAIYGKTKEVKISEDHKLQPISHYGLSKLLIENYILFLNRLNNLPYLILRVSNAYGKYQKTSGNQGFIPISIGNILSNNPIIIWGTGETIRDYIDIKDVSLVTIKLINNNIRNEIINIGNGEGTSLNEIVKYLKTCMTESIRVEYKKSRSIDADKIILNTYKINSLIDHKYTTIKDGINGYLDHVRGDI